MFTVFLSHNEICSKHHFSPVTLKVWQNFHTEVSAALESPLHLPVSPKQGLTLCRSRQSLFLKDSTLDSITFCNRSITITKKHRAAGRRKSIGNERRLEEEWELSKRHEGFVILIVERWGQNF